MATANVKGLVNEIENMCECSICCVEYDENRHVPRLLPCLHPFCTECLSKHCKRQILKCPLCNKEHFAENGDVKKFPKDNTRRDLKELLEKFSQSLCGICKRHDHVKYLCENCSIRMCRGCFKGRKNNVCNKHNVEVCDETITPDTSLESAELDEKNSCLLPGHENNELKYFCSEISCCKAVCANCIVESHKEHACKSIKDEYDNGKKLMQSSCLAAQEKINEAKELLHNLQQKYASLADIERISEEKLVSEANKGLTFINNFIKNAKRQSNELLQNKQMILDRKKEQLQCFIDNASECCAISEEALTRNNISFLSVEKTLSEKLKYFKKLDVDIDIIQSENYALQYFTWELAYRINRMTHIAEEVVPKPDFFQRLWNFFFVNSERPSCLSVFLSLLGIVFLVVVVWLVLFPLPYASVFKTDSTYMTTLDSGTSFTCYSTETKFISNIPKENMQQSCGNAKTLYVYRGVFTNFSISHGNEQAFRFLIRISDIKQYTRGLYLFEFGVSKQSIEQRSILEPSSKYIWGWSLQILNSNGEFGLINTDGHIVYKDVFSVSDKVSFTLRIELKSNFIISLSMKNKSKNTFETLDEMKSVKGYLARVFVKLCNYLKAHINIKILNDKIGFDRYTLYPNLHLSTNNKTISNIQLPTSSTRAIEKDGIYQDIALRNCHTECIYVLHFRVNSPTGFDIFSLILTNSQFLPELRYNRSLLSYQLCTVTIMFFPFRSYCFSVDKKLLTGPLSVVQITPDEWHSLIIKVDKKYQTATFLFNQVQIDLKDEFIFGHNNPILRIIMNNTDDCVEFRLGNREEFDMLTWFAYKIFPLTNAIWSFFVVYRWFVIILCICTYVHQNPNIFEQFFNFFSRNTTTIEQRAPRVENIERRRRGRRQRIH